MKKVCLFFLLVAVLFSGLFVAMGVNAQVANPGDCSPYQSGSPLHQQCLTQRNSFQIQQIQERERLQTRLSALLQILSSLRDLASRLPATSPVRIEAIPAVGQDSFAERGNLALGDRVEVVTALNTRLNVRNNAGGLIILGQQVSGAKGNITGGPRTILGATWWYVSFDRGVSGWVSAAFLKLSGDPKPGDETTGATITVTSPNGGESLDNVSGRFVITAIAWQASNLGDRRVNIELIGIGGNVIKSIAQNLTNTGSYWWPADVNGIPSGRYKVRISASDNPSIQDSSDNFFTITTSGGTDTPSPAPLVPQIDSISPTSGPVGTRITVNGRHFHLTDNNVKIGDGYIKFVSSNGFSFSFDLIGSLSPCPSTVEICTANIVPLATGPQELSVVHLSGSSNTKTFTVTDSSGSTDTTPPSVPTGLSATAVSSSQINLTWNAASDNVGVTSYRIFRNNSLLTTVTGTSYSNTDLSANTAYNYRVVALDAAGNASSQSSQVSATTQSGGTTPPPTGNHITISSPTEGATLTASANNQITWTSSGVNSVRIDLCPTSGACRLLAYGAPANGSWTLPQSHDLYPGGNLKIRISNIPSNIFESATIIAERNFTIVSPTASNYQSQLASVLSGLQSLMQSLQSSR